MDHSIPFNILLQESADVSVVIFLSRYLGEPRCFHKGHENDVENDEDKQETEDDEGIEGPYAVVVVSETFTTLVPYMYKHDDITKR